MGSCVLAVLLVTSPPAGHTITITMRTTVLWSASLLVVFSCLAVSQETRQDRSLVNTFPFSPRRPDTAPPLRADRQTSPTDSVSFDQVAAARPNNDGKRCIEMVEVTEYDDVVQCDHSYDRRCHTTYVTNYESQ